VNCLLILIYRETVSPTNEILFFLKRKGLERDQRPSTTAGLPLLH